MNRLKVYQAIDTEREFQNELTENSKRPDMIEDFHVGDALSAIRYNLNKAEDCWYIGSTPHQDAITYLRKIAAICVNIGEKYGMPSR
jgi:hypothetical protein